MIGEIRCRFDNLLLLRLNFGFFDETDA